MLFGHSTSPLPRVLTSQDTGHHQTWRACAPLSRESSLPSLRAVGGLCLEMSPGTWGPDPVLYQLFAIQNRRSFLIGKKYPEMGQAPKSQARPRDTDPLRPSNLASRTLSFVEHTLSTFGVDPCPVRRGSTAAVKCYVRKARFFLCSGEQK